MVDAMVLSAVMPRLSQAHVSKYLAPLTGAMVACDITTPLRQAAFWAQLAHGAGELRYMEELGSGAAYEGRRDLRNINPGDGRRFKGRGPIQLTGRSNYVAAGDALGMDLEGEPEQAALPEVGFRVAVWFWVTHGLNELADLGTQEAFVRITRRINGGTNGLAQREVYYLAARKALGLT